MAFVQLRAEILDVLMSVRTSQIETQVWAGEINVSMDPQLRRIASYLLLTECAIYIVTRRNIKSVSQNKEGLYMFALVGLQEISMEKDSLQINFPSKSLTIMCPDIDGIRNALNQAYYNLIWNFSNSKVINYHFISTQTINPFQNPNRPKMLLPYRYISFSISKNIPLDQTVLSAFLKYEENVSNFLVFPNIESESFISYEPIFASLVMEPGLSQLIFDQCENPILLLIYIFFYNDFHFYEICFVNYRKALKPFSDFPIMKEHHQFLSQYRKTSISSCQSLSFRNVSYQFFISFFNFFEEFSGHLSLSFNFCNFLSIKGLTIPQNYSQLLKIFQAESFFDSLYNISFEECQSESSSFYKFFLKISEIPSLSSLSIISCKIDICEFLSSLSHISTNIRILNLSKNSSLHAQTFNSFKSLPQHLSLIDVSNSVWSDAAFNAFVNGILSKDRYFPLSFILQNCKFDTDLGEIFSTLNFQILRPILSELDISNNQFTNTSSFFRFLETQSPLFSPSHLHYLGIGNCFPINDEIVDEIIQFFASKELWGISFSGCFNTDDNTSLLYLLQKLQEISGLCTLDFRNCHFQIPEIEALFNLIGKTRTICNLAIDGIGITDRDLLFGFYGTLINFSNIHSLSQPISDLIPFSSYIEVRTFYQKIFQKNQFPSQYHRLNLYYSLYGIYKDNPLEFGDHIYDLMTDQSYLNLNQDLQKTKHKNQKLLKENCYIRKFIPNISDSYSEIDTKVHPLASLVMEYITTSGRCGITPPTVPPTNGKIIPFQMPIEFATYEKDSDSEIPPEILEMKDDDLIKLSSEISKRVIDNTDIDFQKDVKKFSTFEPL